MTSSWTTAQGVQPATERTRIRRVLLDDHARLPWRFFGRLTAAIQAGL